MGENTTYKYKTVMVIDDIHMNRFIAEKMMRKYSFAEEVISFESAVSALDFLQSKKDVLNELPDLIFLDLQMPEVDGFEFLNRYLDLPGTIKNKIEIIVLTSSALEEDSERSLENPYVKAFITKPLSREKLKDI